jgi:hypothetical protein
MRLLEAALAAPNCVVSVMGDHAEDGRSGPVTRATTLEGRAAPVEGTGPGDKCLELRESSFRCSRGNFLCSPCNQVTPPDLR